MTLQRTDTNVEDCVTLSIKLMQVTKVHESVVESQNC